MDDEVLGASHLLWPDGTLAPGRIEIADGRVVGLTEPSGPVPERVLAPGFVDIQVNGHEDVDVASATGAQWERLDEILLAQGVTSWCPTVITAPASVQLAALDRIGAAARRQGARPTIVGAHLEGPWLGARHGAHLSEHVRPPTPDDVAALPDVVRIVTLGPEVDGAPDVVAALVARGVLVSLGHSAASFEVAEAAVDAGARLVTHLGNAMGPLAAREPGLVGLALADRRLSSSVIADLVHVHPALLRVAAGALDGRLVLVTDAVAWRDAGHVARGVHMVDGVPRLADGTLAGSALTMDRAVRNLVAVRAVDLPGALQAASTTPAALLGLADRGALAPGRRADVVALDTDLQVRSVWVGGVPVR